MGVEINFNLQKLCAKLSFLLISKAAKDLLEYTLVLTLITCAAVSGMNALFGVLTQAFLGFATTLGSHVG